MDGRLSLKTILIIAVTTNAVLFGLIYSGVFWKFVDVSGFYGDVVATAFIIIYLIPGATLVAGTAAALFSKQRRILNFCIAAGISLLITAIIIKIGREIAAYQNTQVLEKMEIDDPMMRALNDPLRPISIMNQNLLSTTKPGDTISISVYAQDSIATGGKIPITVSYFILSGNEAQQQRISLGYVTAKGERSPDGRSIYEGSITLPTTDATGQPIKQPIISVGNNTFNDYLSFDWGT